MRVNRKIILLLFLSVLVIAFLVILTEGMDLFLLWIFSGIPILVVIGLTIIFWLESQNIEIKPWEWLFQDIALAIWILGITLIVGIKNGLSIRISSFFAFLLISGTAMLLHYAYHSRERIKKEMVVLMAIPTRQLR